MKKVEFKVYLTEEEVLAFFRIAYSQNKSASKFMRELIENYLRNTKLPKEPKRKLIRSRYSYRTERVRCWMSVKLRDRLAKRAQQECVGMSTLVRDLILEVIRDYKPYSVNQISV